MTRNGEQEGPKPPNEPATKPEPARRTRTWAAIGVALSAGILGVVLWSRGKDDNARPVVTEAKSAASAASAPGPGSGSAPAAASLTPSAERAPSPPPRIAKAAPGEPCPAGMLLVPKASGAKSPFCLDRTEVTVEAYQDCVSDGACSQPNIGAGCNFRFKGREEHPVNCVDYHQAAAFCAFYGKRLPTEAQWDHAARGVDGREYPWGNDAPGDRLCWAGAPEEKDAGKRKTTCPAGRYKKGASPFGVLDMAGNVWEWTASPVGSDGEEPAAAVGATRILRGGAFDADAPSAVRAVSTSKLRDTTRLPAIGFRCASDAAM